MTTLLLKFADVGVATYATLRTVDAPLETVAWAIDEPLLLAVQHELAAALPEPCDHESRVDAIERAVGSGPWSSPDAEVQMACRLGALLIFGPAWQVLRACTPDAVTLFVSPSARLARVPWGLLAAPTSRVDVEDLLRASHAAVTQSGPRAAEIDWERSGFATDGVRLMELADVMMGVAPNVANAPRPLVPWHGRRTRATVLVLDPRVPGQRPDSPLGSVLGRPSDDTALARHFGGRLAGREVLPRAERPVELFRRPDADRRWLADLLAQSPGRLLYVGHASAADADVGYADRAALHLACTADLAGDAAAVGTHRPLTASDLMKLRLPIPPRVALLACASGGDYRFDEATGLVAAMILCGAHLVTATLWSLPTTAGYRRFAPPDAPRDADPMADTVIAVDRAHDEAEAGRALNRWQRECLSRWRDGDLVASPAFWAAVVTFAVDGAR